MMRPDPLDRPPDAEGLERWIWRYFRRNSRTFSLSTRLLPKRVRTPVAVVYWYCRTIDDIADRASLEVGIEGALDRLARAEAALVRCLDGRPDSDPLWTLLSGVYVDWALEGAAFHELIDGARWDLEHRPIVSMEDLVSYSQLVAGSVGEMVLPFLVPPGTDRGPHVEAARELGVAMQLTNVLRDVGEDRRELGRSYLPEAMMMDFGLVPGTLPDPGAEGYRSILEALMAEAERRFERGIAGVEGLLPGARWGIRTAARSYREILNEIRAAGYDNVGRRAVVSTPRKLRCMMVDRYDTRRRRLRGAA